MSQKSVIVATPNWPVKEGLYQMPEVWSSLKEFCSEYGLVYNTIVRKETPFQVITKSKQGHVFNWLVDRRKIYRK